MDNDFWFVPIAISLIILCWVLLVRHYRRPQLAPATSDLCPYCHVPLRAARYWNGKRWLPFCMICPNMDYAEITTMQYDEGRVEYEIWANGGKPMELDDGDIYFLEED